MTTPVYELYRTQTYDLTQSLIIKFGDEAYCNNRYLKEAGAVVEEDPNTWRYYLNLNGEYHYSNQMMEILSIDTQTLIQVTKEVLLDHPRTFLALRPGKRLYTMLRQKYPTQDVLLKGITNPVSKEVAIAAENGTILAWDRTLVENQEDYLIPALEAKIKAIMHRWHIDTHVDVGVLYPTAFLINLTKSIVDELFLLRQEAVHTNRTHSYHIWRFLSSNGKLERYRPYLTLKQVLWLYREVLYIVNNAGLQQTLDELVLNLLTPLGVRVFSLDQSQDTRDPKNPQLELNRVAMNYVNETTADMIELTVSNINQQLNARIDGDINQPVHHTAKLLSEVSSMTTTHLPTKVLETYIPTSASPVLDLEMTHLLRQWGYWALTGRYVGNIWVIESTLGDSIELAPIEAYKLYLAMTKIITGAEFGQYGEFGIPRVVSANLPDIKTYYVDPRRVRTLYNDLTVPDRLADPHDFYVMAMQQREALNAFDLESQQATYSKIEAEYRAIAGAVHRDVQLDLAPIGSSEVTFLNSISPVFVNYTVAEAKQMAMDLLVSACGLNTVHGGDKGEIRDRLSELIEELGSYHIRFVNNELDEAPLNARLEVPKVNDVNYLKVSLPGEVDLGKRYEQHGNFGHLVVDADAEADKVLVSKSGNSLIKSGAEYKASVKIENTCVVKYLHTNPPFRYIEE